jgi:MFS family permease
MAILAGIAWGVRFGIVGAVIGAVFAIAIGLRYRGRRLADINPVRFALLGAVVGGVGVPLFLQMMNVLTGGRLIAWGLVSDDAVWASVFGAAAAAGSILLARRADARAHEPRPDQLDAADDLDGLPAGGQPESTIAQRARSTQR